MPSLQHEALAALVALMRRDRSSLETDRDRTAYRQRLVARNRAHSEGPPRSVRRGRQVSIANDAGFPVFTLTRAGRRPTRTVFYLHGGGFCRPADARHWTWAAALADELDARLVLPAFPLAPEHSHATSHEQLAELVVQAAEVSPDGVDLVGDSAGGGYALALAQTLRDRARTDPGSPVPRRLVLISPWVDLRGGPEGPPELLEAAERDPWQRPARMALSAAWWAGSEDPDDLLEPRVSPALGYLGGLPPALMFCGTRDLMLPQCEALFARADEQGWTLDFHVSEAMIHLYRLPVPEGRVAADAAVDFLR